MNRNEIIRQIKFAAKQGLLLDKMLCLLMGKIGLSNLSIQRLQIEQKIFNKLRLKYYNTINIKQPEKMDENKTIWVCWLQGIDSAPILVKKCYNSVLKCCNEWKVIFLDKNNFQKYIALPDYIIKKWEDGIISNQHFCDALRIQLIAEHGGLWLDATVYLTGAIPKYITRNSFFVYSHQHQGDEVVPIDNWLIYAQKGSPLAVVFRDIVFEYWKNEKYACHYFFCQMLFKLIIDKYPEYWEKVPFVSSIIPHTLHHEIFREYNDKRFKEICELTPVHKLSNRYDTESIGIKDTFYDKLIRGA